MKPDPYLVTQAIKALDVSPARTVLVGDSATDMLVAQAAGVHALGYANKPGKCRRLTDAGVDATIADMHTLARALDTRRIGIAL